MADIVGVTKRTYIYWEQGERQIKPEKAKVLADYFGVTVGYLLGYEDIEDLVTETEDILKKVSKNNKRRGDKPRTITTIFWRLFLKYCRH